MIPLYWDERKQSLLDKCPVIFKLPEGGDLRCPVCNHKIKALLHYTIVDVYEMFCMECGFEKAHPAGCPGMYWNFVREWEHKQNKHAEWADTNR